MAIGWSQSDPKTWSFEIRKNIKWSDGSQIQLHEIADFFRSLKDTSSRHIAYLRLLDDVEVDRQLNLLHFRFKVPVGRGLLHELSLADAVMLHPKTLKNGWSVGSGPYVVEAYSPETMQLKLMRNEYSADIFGTDGPEKVELFWTKEADFTAFFSEKKADIFTSGAFSFRKKVLALDRLSVERIPGYPTVIYYFQINPENQIGSNAKIRRAFSSFVQEFFKNTLLPDTLTFEDQMITSGFQGRLASPVELQGTAAFEILKGMTFNIGLFPQMAELKPIFDDLSILAQESGFKIKFEYGDGTKEPFFATVNVFKGNQRDASGTWSFLITTPSGPLKRYQSELESMLLQMVGSPEGMREEISRSIHRKILESQFLIPFMNELAPMYTSSRVDLSRWNPFDMRLRFYDVRFR